MYNIKLFVVCYHDGNFLLSVLFISLSCKLFGLVWFCGISTIVGYLMPNPLLYIKTVLFQTIQFSISTQFQCQRQFYFKQFFLAYKNNSISNNAL